MHFYKNYYRLYYVYVHLLLSEPGYSCFILSDKCFLVMLFSNKNLMMLMRSYAYCMYIRLSNSPSFSHFPDVAILTKVYRFFFTISHWLDLLNYDELAPPPNIV